MICDICGHGTHEWNECDGKKYCPRCYQDAQERGKLPLTRHANVHDCFVCGDLVRGYGVLVGDMWVCINCVEKEDLPDVCKHMIYEQRKYASVLIETYNCSIGHPFNLVRGGKCKFVSILCQKV